MAHEDSRADRNEYFKNPVSRAEVPDYYEKIKKPMCWSVIEGKLERHEYWDLQTFKVGVPWISGCRLTCCQDDITLVIDNAIKYNKYDTQYYKVATRLRALSKVVLPQLNDVIVPRHLQGPPPSFELDQEEVDPSAQYAEASNRLGDLEPPLRNVELLFSNEMIQEHEDMEFLLDDQDPISSLVTYDLGVPKHTEASPPPPSPPQLPPTPLPSAPAPTKSKAKGKSKKGSKNHPVPIDVEQFAVLDSTPGFRAPMPRVQGDGNEGQADWSPIFWVNPEVGSEHHDAGPAAEPKGKKGKPKVNLVPAPTLIPTPAPGSSGPEHEPQQIETIDKQQSFKMFNEGWILPPDQKRGGRTRAERPPPLPSKKKKPRMCLHPLLELSLTYSQLLDSLRYRGLPHPNLWNSRYHQRSRRRTSWTLTWNPHLSLKPKPRLSSRIRTTESYPTPASPSSPSRKVSTVGEIG